MKGNLLLITGLVTGLSAGLFYSWQVSVIPGTRKVTDYSYLESMQSINREILNPWFFVIFFGPVILMIVSAFQLHQLDNIKAFVLVVVALIAYAIGTVGVTSIGNVPLNNMLEAKELVGLSVEELNKIRLDYEVRWNRLHLIRTVFSLVSFTLLLWASKVYFLYEAINS